jgi:hypothetical protein
MFVIEANDMLASIPGIDALYYRRKRLAFLSKSISKTRFRDFKDRPSFAQFMNQKDLSGTIYTFTCEGKNRLQYEYILKLCKEYHNMSRRCNINFADTLYDYLNPEVNTSCLNSIHFYKDNVTLYFRASDIKNELLIDLHLIKEFFIDRVGAFKTITVIASTAQNVETDLTTLIQ